MPIAQDMKNLTEDIEVSWGERVALLSDLKKETNETLKTFHREHQKMAGDLRDFLKTDRTKREKEVATLMGQIGNELSQMARALKDFLGESESTRLEASKALLAEIKRIQKARNENLATMLSDFRNRFKAITEALHKDLAGGKKRRHEEVREMLADFRDDLGEAQSHWQNLAKIMASKRTGKRVPIAEVPKEAEVSKRVEEVAERAFTKGELKVKALALIEESPKGISLRQLGMKLRVPYIRLGKPIKELLDEGKVVKKDNLYLPVSAEV